MDKKPQTALSRLWEYLEAVYSRDEMLGAKSVYDAQNREYQQFIRDEQKRRLKKDRASIEASQTEEEKEHRDSFENYSDFIEHAYGE